MRIGILTFHCAHNYGAVLQCYALQEVLKGMGHTVEVIDYRPYYLTRAYKIVSLHRIFSYNPLRFVKRFILECLSLPKRAKRFRKFDAFMNEYYKISSRREISSDYDVYIMGSDQIWNPKITKGFDGYYFGYFPFSKGERKYVAYAASMETNHLSESAKEYLRKALNNFDAIGVREIQLADLLRPLTDKDVQVVLDPTLLVTSSFWNRFVGKRPLEEKYVLVYQARGESRITKKIANYIANQLEALVVTVSGLTYSRSKWMLHTESPWDFVNWFRYADCVVSSSFHGTAFSIVFNKPFYSVRSGRGDTRENSLLRRLNLRDRLIDINSLPIYQDIDYKHVNDRLDKYRKESLYFLKSILE